MILNLTQHKATPEQVAAGVVDLSDSDRASLSAAMTFNECPDERALVVRAETIAMTAAGIGHKSAMIGGAPYFMRPLEKALWAVGIRPLYAFSMRESVERTRPDGTVEKVAAFRHVGFVGTEFSEPRL